MAAYDYYDKKGDEGLPWSTKSFVDVLEYSEGTMKDDDTTGELVLGDREVFMRRNRNVADDQGVLDFDEEIDLNLIDSGFKECK